MQEAFTDRKDQRRHHIVATARAVFLRNGYGGTTMSEIAASLGGSKTTLWSYFRNKQDLFTAVIDDMVDQYGEALRMPLAEDGDARVILMQLGLSLLETLFQPDIVALHRMMVGEAERFPELGCLLYERGPKRGQDHVGQWLSVQMARGKMRQADPAIAAQHFQGLCQSGSFQRHLLGAQAHLSKGDKADEVRLAVEAFLRAYAV